MSVTLPRADIKIAGDFAPTRDFYRWMRDITERVGGVSGDSTTSIQGTAQEALTRLHLMRLPPVPQIDVPQLVCAVRSFLPRPEAIAPPDDSQNVLASRIFNR